MDIRLAGKWGGTYYTFEEFSDNVIKKVWKDFFNDDTLVVIKNHHNPEENYTIKMVDKDFSDFISADNNENKNKLFIVNYGWHSNHGKTTDIAEYFNTFPIANNPIARYNNDLAFKGETPLVNKNGEPIFSFYHDEGKGYNVLWCLSDACHLTDENTVKFWKEYLLKAAICAGENNVFLNKYSEMSLEDKKSKFDGMEFVSIKQKAAELIGKNKKSIVEEMLDKLNYKELVNIFNTAYKYQSGNKSNYITKEQVRAWLKPWAENKIDYYILFGKNLELSIPLSIALDIKKDYVLIKSNIVDIKKKFPKYALILEQFSAEEIFENKIREVKRSLEEWLHMEKGQKVTKYISNLCNDNELDTSLSAFIQNKKIESMLHISIDPMEFLTSSITKHGWHSCHNFISGQYGSGSVDYMFDNGSLIAFLANDKVYDYNVIGTSDFQWTSKSWRQIIYGSTKENNFIFCREYPQDYSNGDISSAVRSLLENKVSEFCSIPNTWIKKKNGAKSAGVYVNKNDLHYDDVPSRETVYIKHVLNKRPNSKIEVGEKVISPISGRTVTRGGRTFI